MEKITVILCMPDVSGPQAREIDVGTTATQLAASVLAGRNVDKYTVNVTSAVSQQTVRAGDDYVLSDQDKVAIVLTNIGGAGN